MKSFGPVLPMWMCVVCVFLFPSIASKYMYIRHFKIDCVFIEKSSTPESTLYKKEACAQLNALEKPFKICHI